MNEDGTSLPEDVAGTRPDDDRGTTPAGGQQASGGKEPAGDRPSADFSLARVLRVVLPIVILFAAGVGFLALDGSYWVGNLFAPRLVPAKGSVFYQGKPVVDAVVLTTPLNGRVPGALAETDELGQFELRTDIRGNYQMGAYAGRHKLTIGVYEPSRGPGPATLKSPAKFASDETTPLIIEIDPSSNMNEFPIILDDYLAEGEDPNPRGGNRGMAERILANNDTDQDERLSMAEIESVDEQYRERMKQADSNGDGYVDRLELRSLIESAPGAGEGEERTEGTERTEGEE